VSKSDPPGASSTGARGPLSVDCRVPTPAALGELAGAAPTAVPSAKRLSAVGTRVVGLASERAAKPDGQPSQFYPAVEVAGRFYFACGRNGEG
jgi:hypothetical protein